MCVGTTSIKSTCFDSSFCDCCESSLSSTIAIFLSAHIHTREYTRKCLAHTQSHNYARAYVCVCVFDFHPFSGNPVHSVTSRRRNLNPDPGPDFAFSDFPLAWSKGPQSIGAETQNYSRSIRRMQNIKSLQFSQKEGRKRNHACLPFLGWGTSG